MPIPALGSIYKAAARPKIAARKLAGTRSGEAALEDWLALACWLFEEVVAVGEPEPLADEALAADSELEAEADADMELPLAEAVMLIMDEEVEEP